MTRPAALRVAAAFAAGALVTVAVVACDDKPQHPTAPEAAAAAVTESPALTPAGGAGVSTVCLAYMSKQSVAQEKLEAAKASVESSDAIEALQTKVDKLDAMVADACH